MALKVFTGAAFRDPALRARFQQTTQVQARLRHPSVVRVEDWGVGAGSVPGHVAGPGADAGRPARGPATCGDRRALDDPARRGARPGRGRAPGPGLPPPPAQGDPDRRGERPGLPGRLRRLPPGAEHRADRDRPAGRPTRTTSRPRRPTTARPAPAGTVYSLGAITFECLTGRPPFAASEQWATLRGAPRGAVPPGPRGARRPSPGGRRGDRARPGQGPGGAPEQRRPG